MQVFSHFFSPMHWLWYITVQFDVFGSGWILAGRPIFSHSSDDLLFWYCNVWDAGSTMSAKTDFSRTVAFDPGHNPTHEQHSTFESIKNEFFWINFRSSLTYLQVFQTRKARLAT
jgi:hypothetical protein